MILDPAKKHASFFREAKVIFEAQASACGFGRGKRIRIPDSLTRRKYEYTRTLPWKRDTALFLSFMSGISPQFHVEITPSQRAADRFRLLGFQIPGAFDARPAYPWPGWFSKGRRELEALSLHLSYILKIMCAYDDPELLLQTIEDESTLARVADELEVPRPLHCSIGRFKDADYRQRVISFLQSVKDSRADASG